MCEEKEKVALCDLIIAAVCDLQEKNGVTACEIADFIAKRRGCKVSQIEGMVKTILCQAKSHGIFCDKKGLYKIESKYDDAVIQSKKECKRPVELPEESEEEADADDVEENENVDDEEVDIKLSQDNLTNDEDDNKCQKPKKRKCC